MKKMRIQCVIQIAHKNRFKKMKIVESIGIKTFTLRHTGRSYEKISPSKSE